MTTPVSERRATYASRLEPGDRLTSAEFERRYANDPEIKKAELVEGLVYMASPVRFEEHGEPQADVLTWIGVFKSAQRQAGARKVQSGDNVTVRLDFDNNFQPDAILRYAEGGSSRIVDGYVEGPPELAVEVAGSTVSIDLHAKKNAYRRNGVAEYLVWRVEDGELDWFVLDGGNYVLLEPDANGVIHSRAFPGLRLAVAKLLSGDLAGVLAEQQHP